MPSPTDSSSSSTPRIGVGGTLRRAKLEGADLQGLDLSGVVLSRVSLRGADLTGATLAGARLEQVDLRDAKLSGVDLRGARLEQVELEGAVLDGLDATGATFVQCELAGIRGRDLTLVGARFEGVSLRDVELSELRLDGAVLEGVGLAEVTLRSSTMVGLRVTGGALLRTAVVDCDLRAANLEGLALRETRLEGCRLDGARLRSMRLAGMSTTGCSWSKATLSACRGVGPVLDDELSGAGAVILRSALLRKLRSLRWGRGAQLGLAGLVGAGALAVGAVLFMPTLWPDALLMARIEGLEARGDVERCTRLLELAELQMQRGVTDKDTRFRLTGHMADCQLELGEAEKAVTLLHRYADWVRSEPDLYFESLLFAGAYQLDRRLLRGSDDLVARLRELPLQPVDQLRALRFEAELRTAQGALPTPRLPLEPPRADDAWRELQLDIALALEDLPILHDYDLGATPTELFVMGEWDRALELLSADIQPPLSAYKRWRYEQQAAERLVELKQAAMALALLMHGRSGDLLESLSDVERLGAVVGVQLRMGLVDQARALLRDADPGGSAQLSLERALLRARFLVDTDQSGDAVLMLRAEPATPADGYDALRRHCWLLAEALIGDGDELGAIDALEPALESVSQPDLAQSLLRRLAAWSEDLDEPQRIASLLNGVTNPVLRNAGHGQELALTILRAQARKESVALDDPALLAVLERGSAEQVIVAADLLLEGAKRDGTIVPVLEALQPYAGRLAGERGERLGLTLVQAAADEEMFVRAVAIADELGLSNSDTAEIRSEVAALGLRASMGQGLLDRAVEEYQTVLTDHGKLDPWVRRDLGRELIDELQAADRMSEALDLTLTLRTLEGGRTTDLWRESMACLIALDDERGLTDEVQAAEAELGPCESRIIAALAWVDQGLSGVDIPPPSEACSVGASSVEQRLQIADLLGRAGRPDDALVLLQSFEYGAMEAAQRSALDGALAGWMVAVGDIDGAKALLDESYLACTESHAAMETTDALLQLLARGEDPQAVVAVYLRFVGDYPGGGGMPFWKGAALVLIRMGHSDLIDDLQGDDDWQRHVQREAARSELDGMMDQGGYEGAWRWIEGAVGDAPSDEVRIDLLQQAAVLAKRSGAYGRLLGFLDLMASQAPSGSTLEQRVRLQRAYALESMGQSGGAATLLGQLLQEGLPPELRDEAVGAYGANLGRSLDPEEVEEALDDLDGGDLTRAQILSLRLLSTDQLLVRDEPQGALALLEPLEGRSLDAPTAARVWDLVARGYAATRAYDQAMGIPERFPSRSGACPAWLSVVAHLPLSSTQAQAARDRVVDDCEPSAISARQAIPMASALSERSGAEALGFLDAVRGASGHSSDEIAQIDVERAGLLAEGGEGDLAREIYTEALSQAEDPMVLATGTVKLIRLVQFQDEDEAAAGVIEAAEGPLDRVGDDLAAEREIIGEVVGALQQIQAWEKAIEWQARAVETYPSGDEQRGFALLGLLRLRLHGGRGEPLDTGDMWREQLAQARTQAEPGSQLALDLDACEAARLVVGAQGKQARILRTLDDALERSADGAALLDGIVDLLVAWERRDAAAVVRQVRGDRFGG